MTVVGFAVCCACVQALRVIMLRSTECTSNHMRVDRTSAYSLQVALCLLRPFATRVFARSSHSKAFQLKSHPTNTVPPQVDVVVGFSNGGEETYNVSAIQGSLHSAAQWNLWVQNFTVAVRLSSQWPAPAVWSRHLCSADMAADRAAWHQFCFRPVRLCLCSWAAGGRRGAAHYINMVWGSFPQPRTPEDLIVQLSAAVDGPVAEAGGASEPALRVSPRLHAAPARVPRRTACLL